MLNVVKIGCKTNLGLNLAMVYMSVRKNLAMIIECEDKYCNDLNECEENHIRVEPLTGCGDQLTVLKVVFVSSIASIE